MPQLIDPGGHPPELVERAANLLSHCDIVNVRAESFSARRHDASHQAVKVHVEHEASVALRNDLFANRFEWTAKFYDAHDEVFADIDGTIIVEYAIDDDFEPDHDAANFVASTTGYFAAYPYARELFESCAMRLQIDPLVLGLLRTSDMNPRSMNIVHSDRTVTQLANDIPEDQVEREPEQEG